MLRMGSKKIRNSWGHSLSHFFLQKLCQFLMARVCEECALWGVGHSESVGKYIQSHSEKRCTLYGKRLCHSIILPFYFYSNLRKVIPPRTSSLYSLSHLNGGKNKTKHIINRSFKAATCCTREEKRKQCGKVSQS